MRILDRYILKSVIYIFLSCIFAFLFLYIIIDILSTLEDILKHHTTLILLVRYYISNLPNMFVQISPFACLLSTVYTFSKLNHNNEIIAMRSSGLSILGIAKNVLLFGLLTWLFWELSFTQTFNAVVMSPCAAVMANLEHAHIVRVDEFGETEGRYWLRMEMVKGVEAKAESGKRRVRNQKSEVWIGASRWGITRRHGAGRLSKASLPAS